VHIRNSINTKIQSRLVEHVSTKYGRQPAWLLAVSLPMTLYASDNTRYLAKPAGQI